MGAIGRRLGDFLADFSAEVRKRKTVFGLHWHERIACPVLPGTSFSGARGPVFLKGVLERRSRQIWDGFGSLLGSLLAPFSHFGRHFVRSKNGQKKKNVFRGGRGKGGGRPGGACGAAGGIWGEQN